ncbi:hypothetical protein [Janibacter sp. GS2]|uniref:hypothetical protein n=1 Tax=Janibacter sp. GS2 TaxID=3442646 RepID=UPI003EBDDD62
MRTRTLAPALVRRLDPRGWDATDRFVALAVVAVLLGPVIAVLRALGNDWAPHGDDATVALRTADVLDGRFPITGMRSTSGDGVDEGLATHHLGPLQFYLLALPLALTGGASAGIAVGGALIAAIASVLTVVWARRLGGGLGVVVFTGGLILAQWAIGPEAMFRPLNPYAPLLPTYLSLLLLWALARGDHRALPPFVIAVSLIAQGNLAFVPLAVALALGAVALAVEPALRRRRSDHALVRLRSRTHRGRRVRPSPGVRARIRSGRWALGLGILVWLPSILEIFIHRPNNPTQLFRWATSGTGDPIGLAAGLRHLSLLAPLPHGGFRPYSGELLTQGTSVGTAVGVAVLVLLAVISSGWRVPQGRASSVWPARVALLANLGMVATASRLPEFPAAPYWVITWLPVVAFTWAALAWRGLAYLENATPHLAPRIALPLAGGLVVAGLGAAVLSSQPRWAETRAMNTVARESVADLGPGEGRHVKIVGLGFVPTLGAAPGVAWEAQRAGWNPHYLRAWPFTEDAEHLWGRSAPEGSDVLFITDSAEPDLMQGMSASAYEVTTVEMEYREGTLGVYRDPGE